MIEAGEMAISYDLLGAPVLPPGFSARQTVMRVFEAMMAARQGLSVDAIEIEYMYGYVRLIV